MDLKELKKLSQNYTVLYVEDDNSIANSTIVYLKKLFKNVIYAQDGVEGLTLYKSNDIDIVITDIQMPNMDGLEMTEEIKRINFEQNILIISAYSDSEKLIHSIKLGVDGYVLKPMDYKNFNEVLYKTVTKLKAIEDVKEYESKLEQLVEVKTNENIALQLDQISNYEQTLFALVDIIESRDTYTGKHSIRVANYSKLIAKELGYSQDECDEIYKAGVLHDLGKVAIPDALLLKPSGLNEDEYGLIKLHVNIGYHMLSQIPMFKNIANIINGHHERSNGTGYPHGLRRDEILETSLIMGVADSFDAMTTNRIYKHRKSKEEALFELETLQDEHFTAKIVQAAKKVLSLVQIDETIHQHPISSLEKERFSYFYKDNMSHLYNESYLDFILNKMMEENNSCKLFLVLLNDFGTYNKQYGWTKGNDLLIEVAKKLENIYNDMLLFRIHGDDFVIIDSKCQLSQPCLQSIEQCLEDTQIKVELRVFDILEDKIDSVATLEKIL